MGLPAYWSGYAGSSGRGGLFFSKVPAITGMLIWLIDGPTRNFSGRELLQVLFSGV